MSSVNQSAEVQETKDKRNRLFTGLMELFVTAEGVGGVDADDLRGRALAVTLIPGNDQDACGVAFVKVGTPAKGILMAWLVGWSDGPDGPKVASGSAIKLSCPHSLVKSWVPSVEDCQLVVDFINEFLGGGQSGAGIVMRPGSFILNGDGHRTPFPY